MKLKHESSKHTEDNEKVKRAREGDFSAFESIVTQYKDMIATVTYGMMGNRQDAEDIGQETFIRFYRSLKQYKGDASLGTYLTRIAINLSLNEIKRRKKKRWFSLEDKYNATLISQNNITSNDDVDLVRKALLLLEPKFRSVIILRVIEGYSTKETANILKLPAGTVLSRLARGQEKLKGIIKQLNEEY